jgi:hypothetical protein
MATQISQYFAIAPEVEDLLYKVDKFYDHANKIGWSEKIRKSINYYYGNGQYAKADGIYLSGDSNELSEVMINKFRSHLRYMLTLVTSERPAYDVRAINTDADSSAQAIVGEEVLEYYLRYNKLENHLRDAAEKAILTGEGFVALSWDATVGDTIAVDPETNEPVLTGDISYRTFHSLEVIRDPNTKDHKYDWVILMDKVNKFDLAANFEEHADSILSEDVDYNISNSTKTFLSQIFTSEDTDMIPVFTLYHRKNKILPEGRYIYFTQKTILINSTLPYKEIPVYRVTPGNVEGSVLGYAPAFDILGIQEVSDDLYSAVVSNARTYSRQIIAATRDAGVNHRTIAEGMSLLEVDAPDVRAVIQPLQLNLPSPASYELIDRLGKEMEQATGINEVIKGEPGPNLRSGNALTFIAAQAVKFNSTLQQYVNDLFESVGTGTLNILQVFARAPRFISVVGQSNKSYLKSFSGDDITNVQRVMVQRASALTNTTAGKLELADNLLNAGLLTRPQEYVNVMETGKLDHMMEADQTELLNRRSENELLMKGQPVSVIMTDNHPGHIAYHISLLDDPSARENPQILQSVLDHVNEHINIWPTVPPEILAAKNIPPSPRVGGPIPGQPAQDGGQPPPEGEPAQNGDVLAPMSEAEDNPNMPSLPGLPPGASPQDEAAFASLGIHPGMQ